MCVQCFLLADEVGLGKTYIACEVINRLAEQKKTKQKENPEQYYHVFYMASNARIARKNIREFQTYKPNNTKKFQRATAQKIEEALSGKSIGHAPGTSYFSKSPKVADRLSMMGKVNEDTLEGSWVLSLSPRTSFQFSKGESVSGGTYIGSDEERGYMLAKLQALQKVLNGNTKDTFLICLKKACEHECHNDLATLVSSYLTMFQSDPQLWDFSKLRRIFGNASALMLKPDMIILDEFQRFRRYLSQSAEYTIADMLDFLYAQGVYPKILLLSATPYQFNHNALNLRWNHEIDKMDEDKSDDNLPFEDFEALQECIKNLIYDPDHNGLPEPQKYIARTERRFFYGADKNTQEKPVQEVNQQEYKKHLDYLLSTIKYLKDKKLAGYASYLAHTPDFWRFCQGYAMKKDIEKDIDAKYQSANPENHLLMQRLLASGLPEGSWNRLWVAPTKPTTITDDWKKWKNFGKTIVFTRYHMAARAAASLTSEYAIKMQGTSSVQGRIDEKSTALAERFMESVVKDLTEDHKNNLNHAFAAFFNTDYAKRAVANSIDSGDDYEQMVIQYCETYDLDAVLGEFRAVYQRYDDKQFIDLLCKILMPQKDPYIAAQYYTDDPNANESHDPEYEANVADRFNSPFYPFIMSVTATAQEGLDFHKYADKIMHWQPADNVSAFQQREGRIDRMGSITLRRRFYELCHEAMTEKSPMDFFTQMNMNNGEQITSFFNLIPQNKRKNVRNAMEAELFPMWYIPELSENSARITRIVAAGKCDPVYEVFVRLIEGEKQYSSFAKGIKKDSALQELCPFLSMLEQQKKVP